MTCSISKGLFKASLFGLAVVLSAVVALADGVPAGDPIVRTGGSLGGDPPASIITTDFTISSSTGTSPGTSPCVLSQPAGSVSPIVTTSPSCFFVNDITNSGAGEFIDELIMDVGNTVPSSVNCGSIAGLPTLFADCDVTSDGDGGTLVYFTDGTIQYGQEFYLDFEGFASGTTTSVSAQLPEPGTIAMLALGLLALGLAKRRSFQELV